MALSVWTFLLIHQHPLFHTTMYLLLTVLFCVPQTCLGQVTQSASFLITDSTKRTPQADNILKTEEESTPVGVSSSLRGAMTTQEHVDISILGSHVTAIRSGTDSSDQSGETDLSLDAAVNNMVATTGDIRTDESRQLTATQIVVSSTETSTYEAAQSTMTSFHRRTSANDMTAVQTASTGIFYTSTVLSSHVTHVTSPTVDISTETSSTESTNSTVPINTQLQIEYITNATGYIQTPDWDGKTAYPPNFNSSIRLDAPTNFSVMISFFAMEIGKHRNCDWDYLAISVGGKKAMNHSEKLVYCEQSVDNKPRVFHTDTLHFSFHSEDNEQHTGFRLYFSFHQQSETPEKLDNGKWNCSVPFWPQFQLHLNCNLVKECSDGRDEDYCPYVSNSCGKDLISIGLKCYIFIAEDKNMTWNDAANYCLRHGAYLASLKSPQEWEQVINFVRQYTGRAVYFGLQACGTYFPQIYHKWFCWSDSFVVLYAKVMRRNYFSSAACTILQRTNWWYNAENYLFIEECDQNITKSFLCEKEPVQHNGPQKTSSKIAVNKPGAKLNTDIFVSCPNGHFSRKFLACDIKSACWASQANQIDSSPYACDYKVAPRPPSFWCLNSVEYVPYSLVCDYRSDCSDNSDENFCVFHSCRVDPTKFQCTNKQCVPYRQRCDGIQQCLDGSDEWQCTQIPTGAGTSRPPAIVNITGRGYLEIKSLDVYFNQSDILYTGSCPETHFQCPGNLTYCMPVFVRCNGVDDCPGREDEEGCDRYVCPGFYRCRASPICVHPDHLCDGVVQCPQHDDELQCEFTCPDNCTCLGLEFYCSGQFSFAQHKDLRFLDATASGLNFENLKYNFMLIYLSLAQCMLENFIQVEFHNIRTLDLRENKLRAISADQLISMTNLQVLLLGGNPINSLFDTNHYSSLQFPKLQTLDLSHIILNELNMSRLMIFPELMFLNLTGCDVLRITGDGFSQLKFLKFLNLRGCPMKDFPKNIFSGLHSLRQVWADNYKLCCPSNLPTDVSFMNCHSPSDEISSCSALLRSDFYRVALAVFAFLALIGNVSSFVYRVFINKVTTNLGFRVFVTHLCVSDFLMGVYLATIGVADRIYQGNYLWYDKEWKHSAYCKMAGFLSLLSCEVSSFIICLITFERFLVLRFPFSRMHFRKKSAHVACMIAWLIGIVLAGIPLLPVTEHWQFYSQNGICIPLPITRRDFAGHDYSFSIIIVVSFILLLLVAAGQVFIYWSVRSNSITAGDSNRKSNDLTIARRLITVAMSNIFCWFPICLLGLLASIGVPIHSEVNVAIAIIILPVNSVINPFLYTINMMLEKRRRRARDQRIQMIVTTFATNAGLTTTNRADANNSKKAAALHVLNYWLAEDIISLQNLEMIVSEQHKNTGEQN